MQLAEIIADPDAGIGDIADLRDHVDAPLASVSEAILPLGRRCTRAAVRLQRGAYAAPVGTGYFVAATLDGRSPWREHGSVVVDYHQVPDAPVADGWPAVDPNSAGLQRFVYHETRNFLRRVPPHSCSTRCVSRCVAAAAIAC